MRHRSVIAPGAFRRRGSDFCQNMPVVWENLSDMKTYPRLTIRLSSSELNRVRVLARVRNRSQGQVVREALNLYFRAMTTEMTR